MFLEMIFKIVVVFDPEFPIRVYNKLHQLPLRIAYINLGIVPLATSAFFFYAHPLFPRINHYLYVVGVRGDLSGLPLFYFFLVIKLIICTIINIHIVI